MGIYALQSEPVRNEQVNVGTTSTKIMEQRNGLQKRKVFIIRNISPNATDIITINLGLTTATENNGIILRQYDTYGESNDAGFEVYQDSATAICATATGKISIMER